MNPSYLRIRQPKDAVLPRFARWRGYDAVPALIETDISRAVELATTPAGTWLWPALFIFEKNGWTVFDDLAGSLSSQPADSWVELAGQDELVFAGYNDSIGYGELIVIRDGQVLREFLACKDEPEVNVDRGRLETETATPIKSWIDVASFVDDDDLGFNDKGWLWISQPT